MPLRVPAEIPKNDRDFANWARQAIEGLVTDDIADGSITEVKLSNGSACSILARAGNSAGVRADVAADADGKYLARRSNVLTFAAIADADLPGTIARTSDVSGAVGALNLASGTYVPTLTNVANLDASTTHTCQYLRVGNTVTVSGYVEVNATATLATQLGISLPIASNFGAIEDCAGTAACAAVASQSAAIFADATNNRAQMEWVAVDLSNRSMFFQFTYRVI